jgi:hypothetical protein
MCATVPVRPKLLLCGAHLLALELCSIFSLVKRCTDN